MTKNSEIPHVVDSEEITIRELLKAAGTWSTYLLSKKYILIFFIIMGSLLGFLYAKISKPIYTATTTFVLEDEKGGGGGLGSLAGLASIAGVDVGGGGGVFQGDNILQLYKSRKILEKTLLTEVNYLGKKMLLVDLFINFNKKREQWEKQPKLHGIKFSTNNVPNIINAELNGNRLQDSLIGEFVAELNKGYLNISKPDKKLSTIQVDVKAKDEVFAKLFNDELVRNVNEFYISTKTKKTQKNVSILQHKTDSVRSVMNGAIFKSVAIVDATPNLNPTRQTQRVAPSQQAQFSAETNKAVLSEMVKNLELSKLSLLKETPLIQIIDQPVYPLEKEMFGRAKGIVIGGFAAGFLTCFYLIFRKILRGTLA